MLGINYYGILSLKAKSNLPSISFSLNSYICQYLKAPAAKMNYAVILRKRDSNSAQWESQHLEIMQLSLQARKKADLGGHWTPLGCACLSSQVLYKASSCFTVSWPWAPASDSLPRSLLVPFVPTVRSLQPSPPPAFDGASVYPVP